MYSIPKEIVNASRELRKNMTESEKTFWSYIKGQKLGVKFLRQHPIYVFTEDSGFHRFVIPDFYNHEHKIIIEIDGSIHDLTDVVSLDKEKEKLLQNLGYTIIRFSNTEVSEDIKICISRLEKLIENLSTV